MNPVSRTWIAYLRVSTDEQANHGASLDAQDHACRALLQVHGHAPVEVIRDDASGKSLNRPGMGSLIRRIEAGEIAGICIAAIDRLTRRSRDLHELVDLLDRQKVELVSVREKVDTSGPMGRFVLSLLGSIAQLEREVIIDRIKTTMAHLKSKGSFLARPPVGTIAVRDENRIRKLAPCPQRAPTVGKIWGMAAEGSTLLEIAAYLDSHGITNTRGSKWSKMGVWSLLASPSVVGVIVDQATWDRARAALGARKTVRRELDEATRPNPAAKQEWTLAGLCWCKQCGSAMVIGTGTSRSGKAHPYVRCSGRMKRGSSYCDARDLPHDALEAVIVDAMAKRAALGDIGRAYSDWYSQRQARMESKSERVRELQAKRDKLKQRLTIILEVVEEGGDIGRAARPRLGEVQRQVETAEGELAGLEAAQSILARDAEVIAQLAVDVTKGLERLPQAGREDRTSVLRGMVDRIEVSRELADVLLTIPEAHRFAQTYGMVLPTVRGANTNPTLQIPMTWKRIGQGYVATVTP